MAHWWPALVVQRDPMENRTRQLVPPYAFANELANRVEFGTELLGAVHS